MRLAVHDIQCRVLDRHTDIREIRRGSNQQLHHKSCILRILFLHHEQDSKLHNSICLFRVRKEHKTYLNLHFLHFDEYLCVYC
ncbi:hypothetical protein AR158_c145R [Paramecium bursaria Chlorella virus AR158]|uniref:hypothetical protein n=1 Tax=Paramecium bursaria Chlorella virus AR158 TaxID=380598 RepID=UPI00015AA7F0|nr:hypothetical protein AR158_c145R [Paramecium bursaria Chlorella virus AR158]ABU43691.1 hypothetical protein AR158_c145R [Paramecium bursaria Chlorella virus AR158]